MLRPYPLKGASAVVVWMSLHSSCRAGAPRPNRRARDSSSTTTFEVLARAGFVARGVIYAVIGILAVKLALGDGGKTTNQSGALKKTIAQQPFGQVLLILVAIGLAGYSLWRLFRAFLGHGPEDSDSGLDRVSAFASGIAYAIIFVLALEILLGSGASSGSPKKPTAGVLGWPSGDLDRRDSQESSSAGSRSIRVTAGSARTS